MARQIGHLWIDEAKGPVVCDGPFTQVSSRIAANKISAIVSRVDVSREYTICVVNVRMAALHCVGNSGSSLISSDVFV